MILYLACLLAGGLFFWTPTPVRAASDAFSAELAQQSNGDLRLLPGQAVTVWAEFRNTGSATWTKRGKNFVALNVADPAGRASAFRHAFWSRPYRPAKMTTRTVEPGGIGRVTFALRAPRKPGTYSEHFQLVAENLAWVPGGSLQMTITVVPPYEAAITGKSFASLTLEPGQAATFWVDVKNTGSATWTKQGKNFVALNVTDPAGRASAFRHAYWPLGYRPAKLAAPTVPPGKTVRVVFALQAPGEPGKFQESFQLVAENLTWIPGSFFTVPVTVASPTIPVNAGEPFIDVGLRAMEGSITIAGNGPLTLLQGAMELGSVPGGATITLSYDGAYRAEFSSSLFSGPLPYTVAPADAQTVLEAANYENRPGWNTALNDNRFRGTLRLEHSAITGRTWLINTLPLEHYLRGIAEGSNGSPMEYLKALMTAARSYAHYHIRTGTKHADEHFTVDATNDQVYRGYNFELRSPNVAAAVEQTRGLEVAYNKVPVITPYFSQSDGRTRSWEEVWSGGPYPWLVSVPDPAGAGRPLLGHGVGMSGLGSWQMATEGKDYAAILAYFYTGTTLVAQY